MPRLDEITTKQMQTEILTEAFSLREIGRHFGVSISTVRRHKSNIDADPDIRLKFQQELNKEMIKRDGKGYNSDLIKSQISRKIASREANEALETATIARAATLVMDVIESHRQITQDAMIGVKRIQAGINAQAETEDPDVLRGLAQAQRQNSSSIVNLINCDRRSYNIDDPGAGDDAPDAVNITFYRVNVTQQIEDVG